MEKFIYRTYFSLVFLFELTDRSKGDKLNVGW